MDERELRAQVVATGIELLRDALVARTWGNISARVDENRFLITPSGLDYVRTKEDDLALYDRTTGEWEGRRKPSSEKGIHAAAYEIFPEVGFVIHTHQVFASAIGVAGFENLDIKEEERKQLGGIARASYGLPGTKKLKNAVRKALEAGNHTVLMQNHGALIAAESKEKAYANALLLEQICKRSVKLAQDGSMEQKSADYSMDELMSRVRKVFPFAEFVSTDAIRARSLRDCPLVAQLDDMAQMIGRSVDVVDKNYDSVEKALKKRNSVFVRGCGAIVCGMDKDDTDALKILLDKAAVTDLNTLALGSSARLGLIDCMLMRFVYTKKYSKKKDS